MANKGYILLHRQIQDHWIWTSNDKFDDRSAWIDLLLMVNHDDSKVPFNKGYITVKRGQHLTSQVKLASRWHWTRDRVKRFLKRLENDEMIVTDTTRNNTLVTIVKYDNYQTYRPTNKAPDNAPHQATDKATDKAQTINDIKNDTKNEERSIRTPAPPRDGGEWQ